jgi:polar amino acid transport system substrate-binding protein
MELMRFHIRRATDHFLLQLDDNIPAIRGNPQQLENVIINLIMNACQSLQDRNESLEVSTSYEEDRSSVRMRVRDRGCGIPEENMEKIRKLFFTTRQATGGTGMGLFIVATIIQDHKGTLEFDSAAGKGTTVTVDFPAEDKI